MELPLRAGASKLGCPKRFSVRGRGWSGRSGPPPRNPPLSANTNKFPSTPRRIRHVAWARALRSSCIYRRAFSLLVRSVRRGDAGRPDAGVEAHRASQCRDPPKTPPSLSGSKRPVLERHQNTSFKPPAAVCWHSVSTNTCLSMPKNSVCLGESTSEEARSREVGDQHRLSRAAHLLLGFPTCR
jgi:hypothetical protein